MDKTPAVRVGDIVGAYIPNYLSHGMPSDEFRLNIVLGLEVDAARNALEGLWLVRLSERTEKVRRWDYVLNGADIATADPALSREFVVRTPRIDLLPATAEFFGPYVQPVGYLHTGVWGDLAAMLSLGQESTFNTGSYGPREQLPHTVVKTALQDERHFDHFDLETVLADTCLPSFHKTARQGDNYGRALIQQRDQIFARTRAIHADFMSALRRGDEWNYADYAARTAPQRTPMVV